MSTGFTVMSPLCDGVERLLALHAQRDLLLSDRGRRSLSQLHAALRDRGTWSRVIPSSSSGTSPETVPQADWRSAVGQEVTGE